MKNYLKLPKKEKKLVLITLTLTITLGIFPFLWDKIQRAEAEIGSPVLELSELAILQENSLASLSNPANPEPAVLKKMEVVITAYSSTPWETDDTPFITASGSRVRDGVIANNLFPFGTKVRIPALYGDKIFIVEDRMNQRIGNYQFDIWFPDNQSAKNFGVKITHIEILES